MLERTFVEVFVTAFWREGPPHCVGKAWRRREHGGLERAARGSEAPNVCTAAIAVASIRVRHSSVFLQASSSLGPPLAYTFAIHLLYYTHAQTERERKAWRKSRIQPRRPRPARARAEEVRQRPPFICTRRRGAARERGGRARRK